MPGMSLEDVRQKLEALNRGPMTKLASGKSAAGTGELHRRRAVTDLARLVGGQELRSGPGKCYCIRRWLSECWKADAGVGPAFAAALKQAAGRMESLDDDLARCVAGGVGSLLFADLETCGFAGTPVFLIGVMFWDGGDLCVEQLLARSYEEEGAIVRRFGRRFRERCTTGGLVTFNGKSFDWPFLCDRAAVSRVKLPEPRTHCDLLHLARRRYRDHLPDCRLQTLELHVCHRRRVDDIAGAEIPGAYHDFVRTGDARRIRQIIHHNFLDLVTLAELLADLARPGRW